MPDSPNPAGPTPADATGPAGPVILAGGLVIDPASGRREVADVSIADGLVTAIGPDLPREGATVYDCAGRFVTPGLVDCHSHIFAHVSKVGAPVEEAHLYRGVVAVSDAGTAGASTFEAFKRYVADPSRTRVLSFLNVSVLGLIDFRFGELLNPATLVPEDVLAVAAANPDIIKGLKIRLSTDVVGEQCLQLLDIALATAEQARLPLMVHIGETAATLDDILDRLRRGDVVAHCYTGKENNILDGDKVSASVWAARARGVEFECAHGKSNFSYETAAPAIGEGFFPDYVCSDTSYRNWNGPVFDLLTTMSKLVALGMDFDEVLERATVAPAKKLGIWDEGYGRLEVGGPAHVSIFERLEELEEVPDAAGNKLKVNRLEPVWTVVSGELVEALPWRGDVASSN